MRFNLSVSDFNMRLRDEVAVLKFIEVGIPEAPSFGEVDEVSSVEMWGVVVL